MTGLAGGRSIVSREVTDHEDTAQCDIDEDNSEEGGEAAVVTPE